MRWIPSIALFLVLTACTNNVNIRVLEPYPMFHGNSSKMWIINKVLNKGKNYAFTPINQKDCFFFFKSEKFQMQPVNTIGELPMRRGVFFVDQEGKHLTLSMGEEKWTFFIKQLTLNKIRLQPIPGSRFKYELELISYPESF